ncbi:symporter small accessory protein [Methanofollis fontis]
MFGISDPGIWMGYLLALGFALACVVYGLLNWNNGVGGDRGGG